MRREVRGAEFAMARSLRRVYAPLLGVPRAAIGVRSGVVRVRLPDRGARTFCLEEWVRGRWTTERLLRLIDEWMLALLELRRGVGPLATPQPFYLRRAWDSFPGTGYWVAEAFVQGHVETWGAWWSRRTWRPCPYCGRGVGRALHRRCGGARAVLALAEKLASVSWCCRPTRRERERVVRDCCARAYGSYLTSEPLNRGRRVGPLPNLDEQEVVDVDSLSPLATRTEDGKFAPGHGHSSWGGPWDGHLRRLPLVSVVEEVDRGPRREGGR